MGAAGRAVARLASLAIAAGLAFEAAALAWWASVYGPIASAEGPGGLGNALSCLYSRRGVCAFIAAIAGDAGRLPSYSPGLFWLGIVALCCGAAAHLILAQSR